MPLLHARRHRWPARPHHNRSDQTSPAPSAGGTSRSAFVRTFTPQYGRATTMPRMGRAAARSVGSCSAAIGAAMSSVSGALGVGGEVGIIGGSWYAQPQGVGSDLDAEL